MATLPPHPPSSPPTPIWLSLPQALRARRAETAQARPAGTGHTVKSTEQATAWEPSLLRAKKAAHGTGGYRKDRTILILLKE